MKSEYILMIGMAGSLATSAVIWWWLQDALRNMLSLLCDKAGGTDFWSRYTLLMLLIAPLAVVIISLPDSYYDTTQVVRRIILAILLGHFLSFGLVGRSLFNAAREKTAGEKLMVSANHTKE